MIERFPADLVDRLIVGWADEAADGIGLGPTDAGAERYGGSGRPLVERAAGDVARAPTPTTRSQRAGETPAVATR